MRVDEKATATCPCGQGVTVGYDEHGTPVVLHATPMCSDFESRDALEYVIWLRRKTVGYALGEDS